MRQHKAEKKQQTPTATELFREMFAKAQTAAAAYEAAHPRKARGGKGDARNILHPIPEGFVADLAGPTMQPKGCTADGIIGYLRAYPNGVVVMKYGVGRHQFGSAVKAREFLEAVKAEAAKAVPIEVVQQEPVLPVEVAQTAAPKTKAQKKARKR